MKHWPTTHARSQLLSACGLADMRSIYCNALLLPVLALRRGLDRWFQRCSSNIEILPAPIEWVLRMAFEAKTWWLKRGVLPIGSSVLA